MYLLCLQPDDTVAPQKSETHSPSTETQQVALLFCGRQSPGGHNVIWSVHDALKVHNPKSTLLGFLGFTREFVVYLVAEPGNVQDAESSMRGVLSSAPNTKDFVTNPRHFRKLLLNQITQTPGNALPPAMDAIAGIMVDECSQCSGENAINSEGYKNEIPVTRKSVVCVIGIRLAKLTLSVGPSLIEASSNKRALGEEFCNFSRFIWSVTLTAVCVSSPDNHPFSSRISWPLSATSHIAKFL